MAAPQAAHVVEKVIGHDDNAITAQDVSNFPDAGESDRMNALVWMGKNKVEIAQVPKPKIVEDRDVILKVTGSTVCGSDLHLLHGSILQLFKGDILGHEFCGVAELVGRQVHNVRVGKRYVASFQIACGDCFYCKKGQSSQCEKTNANAMINAMYGGRTAGGQAEYVRVPFGDVNLLELPDDVPDEKGLYLSDVLATSYHCVKDTGVQKGDSVAIFGAGPVGHMAGVFALDSGAKKIIFVDTEPRLSSIKTRIPQKYTSQVEVIDFKTVSSGITNSKTVVSQLKELCDNRGPDVALECAAGEYAKGWLHWLEIATGAETDTSEIVNEMIESVHSFGRCGITGVYVGYRGIRFIGNGQAPVHMYWKDLLAAIQNKDLDPLQMVSHRVRLEDLDKVYYMFDNKEENMHKVFVETKFSAPAAQGSPPLTRY
ncbi:S-(hydroxymethyl)glutathione dehydrogenase [Metarhizium acridum CQMa 102]|uniref:S-(Hydroxymethyl)glutathione dehydrogenase n=1 Tax=Metarhizium acridum (strain CQMa 102) TaxID=655827 RepID=E9ECF4_METAQ|nr:S-(hydroxymethyl)glutathione dehydrogenase [Metarhizium acridum CQMa 102]EFY86407.1 S-(hydroxymethyl)glutathione dehydrogenase [Metarhizium acridum CQMa 102]